jgi:hypothetical protein
LLKPLWRKNVISRCGFDLMAAQYLPPLGRVVEGRERSSAVKVREEIENQSGRLQKTSPTALSWPIACL